MVNGDAEKLNRLIVAVARGHADCLDGIYALAGGRRSEERRVGKECRL